MTSTNEKENNDSTNIIAEKKAECIANLNPTPDHEDAWAGVMGDFDEEGNIVTNFPLLGPPAERSQAQQEHKAGKSGESKDETNGEDKGAKMVDIGLRLVQQNIKELFVDQFDTPFAAIKVTYNASRPEHIQTIPVNKNKFKRWVLKLINDSLGLAPADGMITTICDILIARASFSEIKKTLDLRVSDGHQNMSKCDNSANGKTRIFYDLTNKDWQVAEITPEGWSILESQKLPVMFRRYSNHVAQVEPSREYPVDIFDQFMNLINVKIRDQKDNLNEGFAKTQRIRLLMKCYIISLLIPDIPKPALMLHGEQGAAKTTCQELIKMLIDPSSVLTLVFPGSTAELIQQLSHNHISYFDNKSTIKEWVSDQLCRAVTGTGFSKRKLYSDDDDIICQFKRAIGFNGINLTATKADLLDRGIIVELAHIKENHRRSLREIWTEFNRIRPLLLGYIFGILVKVLQVKTNGGIVIKNRSRMADFEEYAEIISRCMGYEAGAFLEAYQENKQVQTDTALEGKPVARAIIHFMQSRGMGPWSGTATELLGELEPSAINLKINLQREKLWPKAPHVLSRRITEVKTNLRQIGIWIDEAKDPKTRLKTIHIHGVASEASEASDHLKSHSDEVDLSDGNANSTLFDCQVASEKTTQNHSQNAVSDARDATNATTRIVPIEIDNNSSHPPSIFTMTTAPTTLDDKESPSMQLSQNPVQIIERRKAKLQEQASKPEIYRMGNSDIFGCQDCKIRGDKWAIQDHSCSGTSKRDRR